MELTALMLLPHEGHLVNLYSEMKMRGEGWIGFVIQYNIDFMISGANVIFKKIKKELATNSHNVPNLYLCRSFPSFTSKVKGYLSCDDSHYTRIHSAKVAEGGGGGGGGGLPHNFGNFQ